MGILWPFGGSDEETTEALPVMPKYVKPGKLLDLHYTFAGRNPAYTENLDYWGRVCWSFYLIRSVLFFLPEIWAPIGITMLGAQLGTPDGGGAGNYY